MSATTRRLAAVWMLLLVLALSAALTGCASNQLTVSSLDNRDFAQLEADDIVLTMRRCGFTDEEILAHGTEVRNNLAISGAAMIRKDNKVEAIFSIDGQYLQVSTRRRGSFIYNLGKKTFM